MGLKDVSGGAAAASPRIDFGFPSSRPGPFSAFFPSGLRPPLKNQFYLNKKRSKDPPRPNDKEKMYSFSKFYSFAQTGEKKREGGIFSGDPRWLPIGFVEVARQVP